MLKAYGDNKGGQDRGARRRREKSQIAAALRGEECCLAVVFGGHRAHESRMGKLGFDDTDYSVVVKSRARPPNSWRWEIYRAGRSSPIGQSPIFFRTIAAANKAGKAALKQLLAKLNT